MKIDAATHRISRKNFHRNSHPRVLRSISFSSTSGMPPSKVPTGQMYLQKKGAPTPYSDRTKKGTGTVMQYNSPLCDQYNDLKTCPERYWLWFHRLGWKQKLPTGDTFWEHLCGQFESGAKTAATYPGIWESVKIYVDP